MKVLTSNQYLLPKICELDSLNILNEFYSLLVPYTTGFVLN